MTTKSSTTNIETPDPIGLLSIAQSPARIETGYGRLIPMCNSTDFDIEDLRARCANLNIEVLPLDLVRPKNAAVILGVSEKTLANQRSRGGKDVIPFLKQFNRVMYHISDLAQAYNKRYLSTAQARIARNSAGQK